MNVLISLQHDNCKMIENANIEYFDLPLPSPPTPLRLDLKQNANKAQQLSTSEPCDSLPSPPPPLFPFEDGCVYTSPSNSLHNSSSASFVSTNSSSFSLTSRSSIGSTLPSLPAPPNNHEDCSQQIQDDSSNLFPPPPTPSIFELTNLDDTLEMKLQYSPPLPPPLPLYDNTGTHPVSPPKKGKILLTTNLDADTPTFGLPSSDKASSLNQTGLLENITNRHFPFYSVNFGQLWPCIEFSSFWPQISDGSVFAFDRIDRTIAMNHISQEKTEDEDEEEELVNIEQNHIDKIKFAHWITVLTAFCQSFEERSILNEQIGELIRDRLSRLDNNNNNGTDKTVSQQGMERNKLDLFCQDMIKIIQLIINIVRQLCADERAATALVLANGPTSTVQPSQQCDNHDDKSISHQDLANKHCNSIDKKHRLLTQLSEAIKLRDNIDTRKRMLMARLQRKYYGTVFTIDNNLSTLLGQLVCEGGLHSPPLLTELVHLYLTNKESLMVQQQVTQLLCEELGFRNRFI